MIDISTYNAYGYKLYLERKINHLWTVYKIIALIVPYTNISTKCQALI